MSHYERHAEMTELISSPESLGDGPDEEAIEDAAKALRQVEVEAVQADGPEIASSQVDASQLEHMSIDELRALAKDLDVPNRSTITEQDDLIEAIRRRL